MGQAASVLSTLSTRPTKALSGRSRVDCRGSARSSSSVRHSVRPSSSQGSRADNSRRALSISCAGGSSTLSVARSPPRYQTGSPPRVRWLEIVSRGEAPPPMQCAKKGSSYWCLTSTCCRGLRCMAGALPPSCAISASLPAPAVNSSRSGITLQWGRVSVAWPPSRTRSAWSQSILNMAGRCCSARVATREGTSSTRSTNRYTCPSNPGVRRGAG